MGSTTFAQIFHYFLNKSGYASRGSEEALDLKVHYTDLSPLRLRFSDRSPMIEVPRSVLEERPPKEISATLSDVVLQLRLENEIVTVLIDRPCDRLRELVNAPPHQMLVLDEEDMASIRDSSTPSSTLLDRVRCQLPLAVLSPYEVSASVTGSGFFGRAPMIRTLLNHPDTSYTLIGTRRIGKTSLLREVQRRLKIGLPEGRQKRLMYIDCMSFTDTQSFLEGIIGQLYPQELKKKWRRGNFAYFPQFMKRMRDMYKGQIVLFLDEIDYLLEKDREHGYELVRALRTCFEEKSCRFLCAGFRLARKEMAEANALYADTPFNFTTPLNVGNFTLGETEDVVKIPMESLGVGFTKRNAVIKRIYEETGGHPNFVQYYCWVLIKDLDKREDADTAPRTIVPAALDSVVNDEDFRLRIWDVFISNTNDLEKAVAYSVSDFESFTIEHIDRKMKRHRFFLPISDLEAACTSLMALGVIEEEDHAYRFTVPVFPILLQERWGEKFVFEKANEYYKGRTQERSAYDTEPLRIR